MTAITSAQDCCCHCPPPPCDESNPSNATTTMQGGKAVFENDSYRITCGDDNNVLIHNKCTGETYEAWGDPHMKIDGQQAFDFWGTTTLNLDDGTKVTIETTPFGSNPNMTLASKVTITNGDYGVRISGVDTNQTGDLKIDEANGYGELLDAVTRDGNRAAQAVVSQVFELRETFEWRGLGDIPNSGLKMRAEYAQFDAEVKFTIPGVKVADHKACKCGEILKGVLKPWQCKVFGTACTPETPIGTCMVSSEGACAAYYKYGRLSKFAKQPIAEKEKVTV